MSDSNPFKIIFAIFYILTGGLTFLAIWIYSITEWGILLGLMFGWIPALIGGFILGALWPLVLGIIIYFLFY